MSDPTVAVSLQPSNCELDFVQLPPPDPAVDTLSVRTCLSFETIQSDYILLANGTTWVWHYKLFMDQDQQDAASYILGPLSGYGLGILLLSLQDRYNTRRTRTQINEPSSNGATHA